MITGITLDDPARGLTFTVVPAAGISLLSFDVTGSVREDAEDDPNEDGSLDFTRYLGAASVALEVKLSAAIQASLASLSQFCGPRWRPWLTVTDDEWESPRRLEVRGDAFAHPMAVPEYPYAVSCQYSWKAPRGVWEDTAAVQYDVLADQPDTTGMIMTPAGMAVTAADGWVMPASTVQAAALIPCLGTAPPRWTARLYGPVTGPALTRDDTGQSIRFNADWTIPQGSYVEIRPAERRVLWLSDPDADRSSQVDYPGTDWFDLDPGVTSPVRFHAAAGTGPGTVAQITYTPLYIP